MATVQRPVRDEATGIAPGETGPSPSSGELKVLSPACFALVMATGIVSMAVDHAGSVPSAAAFWVAGLVMWTGLTYGVFTALIVKENKPNWRTASAARGSSPLSRRRRSRC